MSVTSNRYRSVRDNDFDYDEEDEVYADAAERRRRRSRTRSRDEASAWPSDRPKRGQHRTVLSAIRQLPHFFRLLYGLLTDGRVSKLDKLLVAAAIGYFVAPVELIPDAIPFLGEIDDLFLLILALKRLIKRAGRDVLLDHWMGDPDDLSELRLEQVLAAAAFFLPKRFRRRLRIIGRV